MSAELDKKIERAIKIMKMPGDVTMELCYSGGKDSDVILELAKMAGIKYRAIYKNTSIDPPGTIRHCEDNNVEIVRPAQTFFQLIEKNGYPNRFCRFCCSKLKEYKIMDIAIQGIRCSESVRRSKRYSPDDPIVCRTFGSKKNHVSTVLPILDWTNKDVEEFVNTRGIKCHPLYYNEDGTFNVNKRLGCMACPLAADRGLKAFKEHPNLVKAWIRAGQVYLDTHPNTKAAQIFKDSTEMFVKHIFFSSIHEYQYAREGIFGELDAKQFLEDYFKIDLTSALRPVKITIKH